MDVALVSDVNNMKTLILFVSKDLLNRHVVLINKRCILVHGLLCDWFSPIYITFFLSYISVSFGM